MYHNDICCSKVRQPRHKSLIFPGFHAETQRYQQCFISLNSSILQQGRLVMLNNYLHFLLAWQIIFLSRKYCLFKGNIVKIKWQPYFCVKVNTMKEKCTYVFIEGGNKRADIESWGHPVPHQDLAWCQKSQFHHL